MNQIKERLFNYIDSIELSKKKFCEITGISYGNITGKSVESAIGSDQIVAILVKFPNLNPDWLLLGEGEMIRKKETESSVSEKMYNELRKEKDELIRENERLKISIEQLKKELARMQLDATASAQPAVSA